MDYYSGAPEPNDYEFNDNNTPSRNKFFNTSFFVLLGIAALVIVFIIIFLNSSKQTVDYNTKDNNSYLKSLELVGGKMEPSFDPETFKYKITLNPSGEPEAFVTLECEPDGKKAKVKGCENSVGVKEGEEVEHVITVTAQNGSVSKYYFTLVRSDKDDEVKNSNSIFDNGF